MDKLELKCAEVPEHITSLEPVANGCIDLCVLVGSTRNRNRHTRAQAEQLRDWLSEYLAQPTPEEDPRIATIRELVKPIPIADLVENGTDAPQLLVERIRKIREALEGRNNG